MPSIDIPYTLGLFSVALLTLIAVQLFSISRAPGWSAARSFAWVVSTAAIYGVVFAAATSRAIPSPAVGLRVSLYLLAGGANALTWLWFSRAPEARRWRDLPRLVSRHMLAAIVIVVGVTLSGHVVDMSRTVHATVETLGADYERPLMSVWGLLSALAVLSLYLAAALGLWRRRAESDMPLVIAGYVVFLTSVFLELGIGILGWPLFVPAPVGFFVAVLPVGLQFQRSFLRDASRLAWLSSSLQGQLVSRTEERDAARDALLRQERVASIGRLASSLAHELGNPLQHVTLGLTELERLPSLMGSAERRLLGDVGAGVDRMRDIVHRMHDLVDHAEWHQQHVSLRAVVQSAIARAMRELPEAGEIRADLQRDWVVSGNESALMRALGALLANAVAAAAYTRPERPRGITVRLTATSGDLPCVEVQDSGPGFAEEVLALAGEPFITAGETAGLGLFLVHRIMHAHGGRVALSNVPEGGAKVSLMFPMAITMSGTNEGMSAAQSPVVERSNGTVSPLSASSRGATILLVDDEPMVRNAFARVLERAGHHVLRAAEGEEALRLLRAEPVDLVITDLMMPGMNGVDFAGVLAEQYRSLREHLIVVCGGAITQDAVRFLHTPGLRVLNKPVAPSALIGAVNTALAARELTGWALPSSPRT